MELLEVLEKAKRELSAITGLKSVSVTHASRGDKGWQVRVEMLEMSRIPSATDVLGEYEVLLSEDSGVLKFERRRTRLRGEPTQELVA